MAIRGHQSPSEVIRGHQRYLVVRHEDDAPIKALDAIRERCHGLKVKVVRRLVEHEDVRLDVPDEGRTQTHSDAISQGAEYLMKEAI